MHRRGTASRVEHLCTVAAACLAFAAAGCATLPDTRFLSDRYAAQSARFESARGPVSKKRSAIIVANLGRNTGDVEMLGQQIALEQEIVGSPLVVGNRATLLQDGPATYAAMFSALAGARSRIDLESYIFEDGEVGQRFAHAARSRIDLESYIFEDGEVGQRFAQALLDRRAHGVQVNVIYDSVGTIGTDAAFFDRLRAAGVKVVEFNPLNPLAGPKAWAPNHRDHRKLLIVDGRVAFLGGINISNAYSSGSSPGRHHAVDPERGWRDTDIAIEGPVVAQFQALFADTWEKQKGEPLAPVEAALPLAPAGRETVRAIGSTPDDPYSLIYLTLIAAITNANRQVHLTNAYFVPDPQLMKTLVDAAKRGVDVRLVLPSVSDSEVVANAGRSHYEELLEAGVKIYERRGALLHAKTAVVDGIWSCVGSSNLDWRSALDNDEINAVILGRGFAAQMEAAYAVDIAASEAIDLATWRRRPLMQRLRELTARVGGPLL
jgi:cardiolipin synthase